MPLVAGTLLVAAAAMAAEGPAERKGATTVQPSATTTAPAVVGGSTSATSRVPGSGQGGYLGQNPGAAAPTGPVDPNANNDPGKRGDRR
jgi:hypothetical protein